MVAQHVIGPGARRNRRLQAGNDRAGGGRGVGPAGEGEVEGEVHLVERRAVVAGPLAPIPQVRLAHRQRLAPCACLLDHLAQLAHERMDVGKPLVMAEVEHGIVLPYLGVGHGIVRRVGEGGILGDVIDGVEAEAVHAARQPEAQHVVHRRAHVGVAPVEVRLLFEEGVQIILSRGLVPLPDRAAHDTNPVVGRRAIRLSVLPDVPVALGIRA